MNETFQTAAAALWNIKIFPACKASLKEGMELKYTNTIVSLFHFKPVLKLN